MNSLYELIKSGFGNEEDFNCAEKILYGANSIYNLNLEKRALKLSAGFGGGMGVESVCGAITGSIMSLSDLFVSDYAHESELIKEKSSDFITRVISKLGSSSCKILKEKYRTDDTKCMFIILECAQILDSIYIKSIDNRSDNE